MEVLVGEFIEYCDKMQVVPHRDANPLYKAAQQVKCVFEVSREMFIKVDSLSKSKEDWAEAWKVGFQKSVNLSSARFVEKTEIDWARISKHEHALPDVIVPSKKNDIIEKLVQVAMSSYRAAADTLRTAGKDTMTTFETDLESIVTVGEAEADAISAAFATDVSCEGG